MAPKMAGLLLAALLLAKFQLIDCAADGLPSLWDEAELDAASQSAGSFRLLSEVHLDDNKASYLIEEWFDGPSQLFRMDVLAQHDDQSETTSLNRDDKKSILVRGATSERHFFQPFQCSPFESLNWALGPNLGSKFPRDGHQLAVAGLGAIWLFATRPGARPATFKGALVPLDGSLANKRTRARTLRALDQFTLDEDEAFPYKIRFYFVPGGWRQQPDGKLDPDALVAVHLLEPGPGSARTKMSARVLEIEVSSARRPVPLSKSLFELPLGYGCTRTTTSAGDVEYQPPGNCFDDQAPGPHVCDLDVLTHLPVHPDDDLDKWTLHTSSLRLVSGRLLGRSYLTLEQRDFSTPQGLVVAPKRSALRRSRRIWDLGPEVPEGGEYSDRYSEPAARVLPMYFELAEQLRVCHAYGNAQLSELPTLEFSLSSRQASGARAQREANQADGAPPVEAESSESPVKRLVGLSLVDEHSMRELFRENAGFHLVRDGPATAAHLLGYREMHSEKRTERLELRDRAGQLAWSGPASLVRRWYARDTARPQTSASEIEDQIQAEVRGVRLTVYLFEPAAEFKRQVGRLQLTMEPGRLVDAAYLHRELDIEPCLQRRPADNLLLHAPLTRDSLAFRLVYPLDMRETQVLALRSDYRDLIYVKFLEILATRLWGAEAGDLQLHTMQLSDLQVDMESNLVAVSGRLHRWPEAFNYIKWPPARLAESKAARRLVLVASELKPTSEQCAQSCSHLGCPVFMFDQVAKQCLLYQAQAGGRGARDPASGVSNSTGAGQPLSARKHDAYCAVYERRPDAVVRAATPRQVLERINGLLNQELGIGDDRDDCDARARTNPLTLELEPLRPEDKTGGRCQRDTLVLVPSELHVGSGAGGPRAAASLMRLGTPDAQRGWEWAADESLEAPRRGLSIRAEFEILFKNRKFRAANFHHASSGVHENFPLEEASSVQDQWECERLCREHDCRSFSYCQLSQKCMVSELHTRSAIEATSEEGGFCVLLAREYLSKFDKLAGLVAADELELRPETKSKSPAELTSSSAERRYLEMDSPRDCAISCMEAQDFTCRSFILCPANEASAYCHLFGARNALAGLSPRPRTAATSARTATGTMCDLYQRSFLIDYQHFYGKRLESESQAAGSQIATGTKSIRLLRGLDAEECASACSQAIDGGERSEACRAFHVCSSSPAVGKRHQLLCGLLMVNFDEASGPARATDLMRDEPSCSAFVPYDSPPRDSRPTGAARTPSGHYLHDKSTRSHGLVLSALVVLMGLATGYTLTWLIALQNLVTYPAVLVRSLRLGV